MHERVPVLSPLTSTDNFGKVPESSVTVTGFIKKQITHL